MTDLPRDALYHVAFGAGALLRQGGLVIRNSRIVGIGHYVGEYAGVATCDAATKTLALDLGVKVGAATPIAAGLNAGPAGSTISIKASGPLPEPQSSFAIDLVGNKAEMTLTLFSFLHAPVVEDLPPDAFPDGLYRLESAGIGYVTNTVVVLNGGQLLGLGELGGQYRGHYVYDAVRRLTTFKGEARLPPGVPLIVGGAVGSAWMSAPLTSEAKFNKGKSRFSFSLAGYAVDAELTFIKPLPE